jgi:uroporphyrinogen-III synthase
LRHNVEMIASEFFGGMSTHSRKVRIDCAASDPFTTHEVLAAIHGTPLRGKRVVVQRYGETNRGLQARLKAKVRM